MINCSDTANEIKGNYAKISNRALGIPWGNPRLYVHYVGTYMCDCNHTSRHCGGQSINQLEGREGPYISLNVEWVILFILRFRP